MSYLKLITFIFFIISICLIFSQKAYAYIDPGTGSYIFQIVIASAVGLLFALKLYWLKIKTFFAGLFLKKKKTDEIIDQQ